jgi:hypothetical protein
MANNIDHDLGIIISYLMRRLGVTEIIAPEDECTPAHLEFAFDWDARAYKVTLTNGSGGLQ